MDVLESPQYLVEEVAHMVIAQLLCLQQLVHVGLHEALHYVAGHRVKGKYHRLKGQISMRTKRKTF